MPRKRSPIPWLQVRDGVYYVYWYDETAQPKPRTKRVSLGTKDPMEAQQRYAAFLSGGHACFRAGSALGLTVTHALDDYWREHVVPNVVDKTRQEDAITHLKAWFKDTPLKDVDIPASRAYADARRMGAIGGGKRRKRAEGSDSTIRRELVVLQAAANHAERWKRIGSKCEPPTPMPSIELPHENPRGAIGDDDWLTKAELKTATDSATGRLKDFIIVAYDTASRRGAIERLTRFQVDLRTSRLNLTSPHEDKNQRRSKKRRPIVPISSRTRPILERLLEETTTEWLWGDPKSMYRAFRTHMEGLGLAHKANPHILRHTRATHLLQDGVSLWDVAKLLGDTVATVERVYGHMCPEHMAEALREAE